MSPIATEYDSDYKYSKTIKLTYTDTESGETANANYTFTIVNDVKLIAVHSINHKVDYNVNDSLDVTDLEILVTRAVGTPTVESVSQGMVSGFVSNVENTALPLTITYTENGNSAQTTYTVSVVDSVTSVTIQNPPTEAKYGEALDLSGTTIDIVRGSGSDSIQVTTSMISGYDPNTLGTQTVLVTYGGESDTFQVEVKDYVTGITVNPNNVSGLVNATLADLISDNNIEYTVTYAQAGAQTPVALVDSMVSGYSESSTSQQNLTVTYEDNDTDSYTNGETFTAILNVTLANSVTAVEITAPTKDTYNHGDSLDLSTAVVTLTYADGTTGTGNTSDIVATELNGTEVNMTPASTDYDADHKYSKTVNLRYTDSVSTETDDVNHLQ